MRILTLIVISIFCSLLWLFEVIIHGWDGLIWITYFHFSVPISIFIVISWLAFSAQHTFISSIKFIKILVIYAITMYLAYDYCLVLHFVGGPRSILYISDYNCRVNNILIFPLIFLTPISFHYLIRFTTVKVSHFRIALSTILFSISPFIGLLILVSTTDYNDYIHVVKSGSAIAPMILSLCFPYVFKESQSNQSLKGRM